MGVEDDNLDERSYCLVLATFPRVTRVASRECSRAAGAHSEPLLTGKVLDGDGGCCAAVGCATPNTRWASVVVTTECERS